MKFATATRRPNTRPASNFSRYNSINREFAQHDRQMNLFRKIFPFFFGAIMLMVVSTFIFVGVQMLSGNGYSYEYSVKVGNGGYSESESFGWDD